MCKKSLVLIILVLLSNLAFGQAHTVSGDTQNSVALSRRNSEIDDSKYAHPTDFLYEEQVVDVAPEDAAANAQEQKLQEAEAAEQAAINPSNEDL